MKTFARVRSIAFLLRVVAVSAIFSAVSFFFPEQWIDSFDVWWGVESPPDHVLMRYVLWGAGYLQVGIGVVIWGIARDVVRHQPVVLVVLWAFLAGASAFCLIDAVAGLPWYWCLVDFGGSCSTRILPVACKEVP